MINLFKKPTVEFSSQIEAVAERYPIYKAKDLQREWLKQSSQAFKNVKNQFGKTKQIAGSSRCPGIIGIANMGYIVPNWFDFSVEVFPHNPMQANFHIPEKLPNYTNSQGYPSNFLSFFSSSDSAIAVPNKSTALKGYVKVETPWLISIPEGYQVLVLPIPYPDETNFAAVPGLLTQDSNLSIILEIFSPGLNFFPASLPLMQLIPISTKQPKYQLTEYNNFFKSLSNKLSYHTTHKFVK